MGYGYMFNCRKCGYQAEGYEGFGFLFPAEYRSVQQRAREGLYGEELQKYLMQHPETQVNAENIVVVCEDCGHLESVPELSVYLPKDSSGSSTEDIAYLTAMDLQERYTLFREYQHRCERCGAECTKQIRNTRNTAVRYAEKCWRNP
ncbi:MAG: hypothetical protein IKF51_07435 [Solobacterium sp.]|nr:hypothetical protein [Solobacterium sp.]